MIGLGPLSSPAKAGVALICLALAACGGGGSGPSSTSSPTPAPLSSPPPSPTPPPPVGSPADFETPEFFSAGGLDQINAQHAYARDGTGQGVTVAVVDTGVNFAHPDLAPNQHPDSINIRTNGAIDDIDGHGTAVSGIVAAAKNDVGMHGVAFESRILGIRTDNCGSNPSCTPVFFDSDIARAIDHAIDHGAKVINLSLAGSGPTSNTLRNALARASAAGVVVLAAAGNESGSQPLFPSALADDPAVGNTLIAVGAVTQTNQHASFSNDCGDVRDRCLVAPGVNVRTTDPDGSGTVFFSGTSAATPYASGAAAVLFSLFPSLTGAQVAELLLSSTTDLGAAGTDTVFGRGLVNLEEAVKPSGTLSVPTTSAPGGPVIPAPSSTASLGPAFGDALLRSSALLDQSIALDIYRRAYRVELSKNVSVARRDLRWDQVLASDTRRHVDLPAPYGLDVSLAMTPPDDRRFEPGAAYAEVLDATDTQPSLDSFRISGRWGPTTEFKFAHNFSVDGLAGDGTGLDTTRSLFLHSGETIAPYAGLAGLGSGVGVVHALGGGTSAQFGWFDGTGEQADAIDQEPVEEGQTTVAFAGVTHRLESGATFGIRYAKVDENGKFLASQTTGAFGEVTESESHFMTASVSLPILSRTRVFVSYTEASGEIGQDGYSLLTDWSTIRANAFAAGVVTRDVLAAGDRLGFMAGQPLRVYSARATLGVAETANPDGTINFGADRIDVTPTGREIDLQLAYDRPISNSVSLQTWLIGRLQPGHDKDADPDYGAGVRVRAGF